MKAYKRQNPYGYARLNRDEKVQREATRLGDKPHRVKVSLDALVKPQSFNVTGEEHDYSKFIARKLKADDDYVEALRRNCRYREQVIESIESNVLNVSMRHFVELSQIVSDSPLEINLTGKYVSVTDWESGIETIGKYLRDVIPRDEQIVFEFKERGKTQKVNINGGYVHSRYDVPQDPKESIVVRVIGNTHDYHVTLSLRRQELTEDDIEHGLAVENKSYDVIVQAGNFSRHPRRKRDRMRTPSSRFLRRQRKKNKRKSRGGRGDKSFTYATAHFQSRV